MRLPKQLQEKLDNLSENESSYSYKEHPFDSGFKACYRETMFILEDCFLSEDTSDKFLIKFIKIIMDERNEQEIN